MNKQQIKKIMKETCWGSLAYCCSLEAECPIRDEVIKDLGLTKKQFTSLKKKFDEELLGVLK